MKNEKFCFSKGTGLIALIGIVLVGVVLAMQIVGSQSTSTSTRASFKGKLAAVKSNTVKKGGVVNPGSRTFDQLMHDATTIIEDSSGKYSPSDTQNIVSLKQTAENLFSKYIGFSSVSSKKKPGAEPDTIVQVYTKINNNLYRINSLIPHSNKGLSENGKKFYTAQVTEMKSANNEIINLITDISIRDKVLTTDRISVMPDLSTLISKNNLTSIDISNYNIGQYNDSNDNIKIINNDLDFLANAFAALDSALTKLLGTPSVNISSTQTPSITSIPAANPPPRSDVPVCKEDANKFQPEGLGCDVCTPRSTELKQSAGLQSTYFAAFKMNESNKKLERTCYAPFLRAAKSGATDYICNNASCVICLNQEIKGTYCDGVKVACGSNLIEKLAAIPTDYPQNHNVLNKLSDYFVSSNTQSKDYVSTCYLKNAGTFGDELESASYDNQPRGYCADLNLDIKYSGICACMSLINLGDSSTSIRANSTQTCIDAVDQIDTLIKSINGTN